MHLPVRPLYPHITTRCITTHFIIQLFIVFIYVLCVYVCIYACMHVFICMYMYNLASTSVSSLVSWCVLDPSHPLRLCNMSIKCHLTHQRTFLRSVVTVWQGKHLYTLYTLHLLSLFLPLSVSLCLFRSLWLCLSVSVCLSLSLSLSLSGSLSGSVSLSLSGSIPKMIWRLILFMWLSRVWCGRLQMITANHRSTALSISMLFISVLSCAHAWIMNTNSGAFYARYVHVFTNGLCVCMHMAIKMKGSCWVPNGPV